MKKVYTHNGIFHADEVSAIAMLKVFGGMEIEVVRVGHQTVEFEGADIVLDIGRIYDGQTRFDHHQDLSLKSSAGLIWEWLGLAEQYSNVSELVELIDANDIGTRPCGAWEYPNMVSAYNAENPYGEEQGAAFQKALEFACTVFTSLKKEQEELARAEAIVAASVEEKEGILFLPEYTMQWSYFVNGVKMPNITAVAWEDKVQGNFKIQKAPKAHGSFEFLSDKFSANESMTFVHAAGFFAVAPSKEVLLSYIETF